MQTVETGKPIRCDECGAWWYDTRGMVWKCRETGRVSVVELAICPRCDAVKEAKLR